MKKLLTVVAALAVMVILSASASASEGAISSATLKAMGLSGMQVMTDDAGMDVRGFGYQRGKGKKSLAIAFGASYAHVGGKGGSAGSVDGYLAVGKHFAGGAHGSVAGKTTKHVTKKGRRGKHVKKHSVKVYAGGFAVSSAY